MQVCSTLIAPSMHEGFGLVAVEAVCTGAPVLASDIPAFQEVLGSVGLNCAFQPGDVISLVTAIKTFMHHLPQRTAEADALVEPAMAAFSSQKMVDQYLNVYRGVLRNPTL